MKRYLLGTVLICAMATSSLAQQFPQSLEEAHEAYAQRDFVAMTGKMREALMNAPHDKIIRKNIFSLMREAYIQNGKAGLPTEWELPDDIRSIDLGVFRISSKDGTRFRSSLKFTTDTPVQVDQIRLTRYPDKVMLDHRQGIGEFERDTFELDGKTVYTYRMKSKKRSKTPRGGLYEFELAYADGRNFSGWVILDDEIGSSTDVNFISPTEEETMSSPSLVLKYDNYTSPEYNSKFERRSLWQGLFHLEGGEWPQKPLHTTRNANPKRVKTEIKKPLENGRYFLVHSYSERRFFGPVTLRRATSHHTFFNVKKSKI